MAHLPPTCQHEHGTGFAGPVMTQQRGDLTLNHVQVQIFDSWLATAKLQKYKTKNTHWSYSKNKYLIIIMQQLLYRRHRINKIPCVITRSASERDEHSTYKCAAVNLKHTQENRMQVVTTRTDHIIVTSGKMMFSSSYVYVRMPGLFIITREAQRWIKIV